MSFIGNTPVIPVDALTPITNTLTTDGQLLLVDTTGYNSISVQLTGTWGVTSASVTFQASNDNVNWVNVQGFGFNSGLSGTDTALSNDIYICATPGKYFSAAVIGLNGSTCTVTAFLRSQSTAGYSDSAITQTLDDSSGIQQNIKFPGFVNSGQQAAVNSLPVAMANEQILDKIITGKNYVGSVIVNTDLALEVASVGNSPAQPLDCLQYRSVGFQIYQSGSVTAGGIIFEASNDGITWTAYPMYAVSPTVSGAQSTALTLSTTAGQTLYFEGPLYLRFFRLRVSTAISSTATQVQAWLRLSMAPYTKYTQSQINVSQFGANGIPTNTTQTNSSAVGSNFVLQTIGGIDRSVTRSEVLGAPSPLLTTQYTGGPYTRLAYFDLAGNMGVAGPQPFLAEDKTYPVNVRLERTTAGQESVQDLLQQLLTEIRATNYYMRELPMAISTLNQTANPSSVGNPASMKDEPESFYYDPNVLNNKNG